MRRDPIRKKIDNANDKTIFLTLNSTVYTPRRTIFFTHTVLSIRPILSIWKKKNIAKLLPNNRIIFVNCSDETGSICSADQCELWRIRRRWFAGPWLGCQLRGSRLPAHQGTFSCFPIFFLHQSSIKDIIKIIVSKIFQYFRNSKILDNDLQMWFQLIQYNLYN